MTKEDFTLDPKFIAGVDMIRRTGSQTFRIGYSDEADGPPTVWFATATWLKSQEAAGALDPVTAIMRLCELVIDGGLCKHCNLPTIFISDSDDSFLSEIGCVYAWDPELKVFRRGCEGE